MNVPSISLRNLNLTLGNKVILDDVSVDFNSGQLTILLGPNGAGKSSLLKMITKEWKVDGEVEYFGQPSELWQPSIIAKHLGVLPQSSSLTFSFTVREVVELGGLTLDASQSQISAIAEKYMQENDIAHLSERSYPTLSGGEKQRVHLSRVLTQIEQGNERKILLLDEPTSALDLSHQHRTLSFARKLTRTGAAVIAVIHDLNLAAQYADRILILNEGKLVADGSPWETLTEEIIDRVYNWSVQVIKHPVEPHPVILS